MGVTLEWQVSWQPCVKATGTSGVVVSSSISMMYCDFCSTIHTEVFVLTLHGEIYFKITCKYIQLSMLHVCGILYKYLSQVYCT